MSQAEHNFHALDHYVYTIEAYGVPFYVGEGRAARAADRVNWARKQRRKGGTLKLHEKVMMLLHDKGVLVSYRYVIEHLTSEQSKRIESQLVTILREAGFSLANADAVGRPVAPEHIAQRTLALIEERSNYRMDASA